MIDYTCDQFKIANDFGEKTFFWSAPSNIALVKYWGKTAELGVQIPANASLSLTLSQARTLAKMSVSKRELGQSWIDLEFNSQKMPSFLPKIEKYFYHVSEYFPIIKELHFLLQTQNSFPHSAGIASSASSMAAIAMNLVELEQSFSDKVFDQEHFNKRASFFARLGSGSACRSIYPFGASWADSEVSGSSLNAQPVELHSIYKDMLDTILIVNANEKSVSSRAGHALMDNHPYKDARYKQADENFKKVKELLKTNKWNELGAIIEEEALSLHGLMMSSRPGYLLLAPETLKLISSIREYRAKTKVPVFFTLDAGPNLHLLYPKSYKSQMLEFINNELKQKVLGLSILLDEVGSGPIRQRDCFTESQKDE